jgi:hypothetical protein
MHATAREERAVQGRGAPLGASPPGTVGRGEFRGGLGGLFTCIRHYFERSIEIENAYGKQRLEALQERSVSNPSVYRQGAKRRSVQFARRAKF